MKRLLSLLLCLGLLTAPALAWSTLEDSLPEWAAGAYDRLEQASALPHGAADRAATAKTVVSRGDFAQALVLAVKAAVPQWKWESAPMVELGYFADADPAPEYIIQAASWGIAQGRIGDDGLRYGDFDNGLSRQEAAKMVCSALDFVTGLGYPIAPTGETAVYADAGAIASWAAPYTGRVAAYQLMVGDQAGNFNPVGQLQWDSALVLADRVLTLLKTAVSGGQGGETAGGVRAGVPLHSGLDWAQALDLRDYHVSKPLTGYALGYYAIDNGDGTLSGLTVPPTTYSYASDQPVEIPPTEFYVESYDAQGNVTGSKSIPMELPVWGGFLDGGDYFYLAFGQANLDQQDSREVYRIVQYDRDWNRIASASVNGGESHTCLPYEATVARMALTPDGKTLALHAARERYASDDGLHHQSNITIIVDTDGMKVKSVSEPFPENHVSHSFGQFVQYDGKKLVTVDHGDAYPRSFLLQSGSEKQTLLSLYGPTGENKTHAIGSGLEVSEDGYLFLGCSARQSEYTDDSTPWNVFLTYTGRNGSASDSFTWLTQGETDIRCARLVKLSDSDFVALWGVDGDVRYQRLDGKGKPVGEEEVLDGAAMPTTQPVVRDGVIRWIGVYKSQTTYGTPQAALFELEP